MSERDNSDQQLIREVETLRQRVAELERVSAECKRSERSAIEREEVYRTLVETAPDFIARVDPAHKIVFINHVAPGFSVEETIGTSVYDYVAPDYREVARTSIERVLDTGKPDTYEAIANGPDGTDAWYTTRVGPIEEDGDVIGAILICTDVTEYKRTKQALTESDRRYRRMVNTLADALLVVTLEGAVVDVNPAACAMYGYLREELLGMRTTDLIHPDYHHVCRDFRQSVLDAEPLPTHTVDVRKDGSTFHTEVFGSKVEFDGMPHLLVIVRDVSEQQAMEQRLHEEASRTHQLLDTTLDGYVLADADGRLIDANPSYCETVGYTRDELLSMNIRQLEVALAPSEIEERVKQLLAAGNAAFVTKHRRKDGESVTLEVSCTVLGSEEAPRIAAFVRDIAERKEAEESRQRHLRYLENTERIDRVIRRATDLEQMFPELMEEVLSILDCDRTWLLFPCDPDAETFSVPIEVTKPEYPGVFASNQELHRVPETAQIVREVLGGEGPVVQDPASGKPLPEAAKAFSVRSQMMMALRPKSGKAWMFGVQQCSRARVWTEEDQRLFKDIGHRIADSLTSLLSQREVQESEEKYRLLVENQTDMIVRVDSEGRLTFVSPSYCRAFGKTREELLNSDFMPLVHEDDRERVAQAIRRAYQPPHSAYVQERAMTVHGWRWQAWMNTGVLDAKGEVVELVCVGRDITAQKEAEAALRKSETLYRTLFESAGDAIFLGEVAGQGLRFVDCNTRALSIFGGTRDEIIGKTPLDLSPPKQPDGCPSPDVVAAIVGDVLKGAARQFEWQHCRVDGTPFDAEVTLNRVELAGRPHVMGAVRDISDRKRAEKALSESEQRFRTMFEQAAMGASLIETATGPAAQILFTIGDHFEGLHIQRGRSR